MNIYKNEKVEKRKVKIKKDDVVLPYAEMAYDAASNQERSI